MWKPKLSMKKKTTKNTKATKTKVNQASALSYDGTHAPVVSASGIDATAEQIVEIATLHEIPIYQNPELAKLLAQIEVGDEIPEMLYLIIAEILALAYRLQDKVPEGWEPPEDEIKKLDGPN